VPRRHFVDVVAVEQLRESWVTSFDVGGHAIILTRTADGIRAFDGTCTHANFQFVTSRLAGGCDIECPMHGACFDAVTGEPTSGPAEQALTQFDVEIENGMVRVDAPWVVQTSEA
jgi:3-phenylpropionate/trans-cinnamate dioxygenase ferredoxin component